MRVVAVVLLAILFASAASAAESGVLPSADEVREKRLFREETALWRRVLALPADVVELTAWPLRQTLFWMERTALPERIEHGLDFPFRPLRRLLREDTPT